VKKKFIIEPEYSGFKISNYLREKGYSGKAVRRVECYLNGKRVKTSRKIKKLNRLLVIEPEKGTNIRSIKMDLKIAYEDDNLLIVDKEPFLVVHPTTKKTDLTLANGVVYYFEEKYGKKMVPRFYNRLDMNTSGLTVLTKNAFTQAFLQEKATLRKHYKAVVKGIVKEDEMMIEIPIGKVGDELRRVKLSPEEGGQNAKTFMKVIKRFNEQNLTLIELELFTGRTHQIRAHMSISGYPILGDELYGGEDSRAKRQLLHAYKFEFTESETFVQKTIEIDLPEDIKSIIDSND